MPRIAILYCKRIKDHSCVACAKCFKGIHEKKGEFARYDDEVELVAMTDCGDCPGLTVSRMKQVTDTAKDLGRPIEVVHFGTCMKSAMETSECPIDPDTMKLLLEKKFGVQVVVGTHSY